MTASAKITINRPSSVVWEFFTKPENWQLWWGGELKAVNPGWQDEATLVWGNGDKSTIWRLVSQKMLETDTMFMRTTWTFSNLGDGQTLVEIIFVPKGGANYTDGGVAESVKLNSALAKLKKCIEETQSVKKKSFWKRLFK